MNSTRLRSLRRTEAVRTGEGHVRKRLLAFTIAIGVVATTGTAQVAIAPATAPATQNPVLIVAGTFSPVLAVEPLAVRLRLDGFTVYTMALPGLGTGDIAVSAQAVATKVDEIRAATGAAKVDLIGHSQGGLENRYYLKFLGGTAKVGAYVSLGTPQYGTYSANLATVLGFGNCLSIVACVQMTTGSSFLAGMNAGDDTPGSVRYYAVYTVFDELVQPWANAKLQDGAKNIKLQSYCPLRLVGHLGLILDGSVYGLVKTSLKGGTVSTNCFAL